MMINENARSPTVPPLLPVAMLRPVSEIPYMIALSRVLPELVAATEPTPVKICVALALGMSANGVENVIR
jgi:hypothetical protein